jgi:hypothetical protein
VFSLRHHAAYRLPVVRRLGRLGGLLVIALLPACASHGDVASSGEDALPVTTTPVVETALAFETIVAPNAPATDTTDLEQVWDAAGVPPIAPQTMLLVGDSGMVDLEPALEATFTAAGVGRVVNSAWPGFGLTRPEFDWRGEWRRIIEHEDPAIVVVMLGGWDLRYLDTHGEFAYAQIVNEALQVLMAGGAKVEWLAMLPGGGSYLSPVNTVYIQARDWSRSVDFFDAQEPLRSPDGTFHRTVPSPAGPLLVRKPDHWHFCPSGAELVAAEVHAHLTWLRWLPSATPGWEDGPWRNRSDVYDNPPGACDPLPPAG